MQQKNIATAINHHRIIRFGNCDPWYWISTTDPTDLIKTLESFAREAHQGRVSSFPLCAGHCQEGVADVHWKRDNQLLLAKLAMKSNFTLNICMKFCLLFCCCNCLIIPERIFLQTKSILSDRWMKIWSKIIRWGLSGIEEKGTVRFMKSIPGFQEYIF